jgi:1A family penicillin-binding protein
MPNPRFIRRQPQYWKKTKHPTRSQNNWRQSRDTKFDWRRLFANPKVKKFIRYAILAALVLIIGGVLWLSSGLPDPNKLMSREVAQSTKIYDRTGETVLYEISGNEKRTLVTLDKIPQHLRDATIAIEDKNFYTHKGFSLWAIFRTLITNIVSNRQAGASTITQQFIKNAVLTSEKSYLRKLKEIILAYRLEQTFTKEQILQLYFNEIPYGSNAYGVEAASMKYFGKNVQDLTLPEDAILAAMVQSPTRYSPYGPNKDLLISRQQYVLDLMVEQKMITKDEATKAKETKVVFRNPDDNIMAPHFVLHIKEMLVEKYGEKTVEQGGLKIITTLDLYKQQIAEEVVKAHAETNAKRFNAKNAALVSIDPKTGQVLAMVGSKDYFDNSIDGQVNVALKPRQPGSSFKPIVYATAFTEGYTPNTTLYDTVTNFSTSGTPYTPHNYNSKEYGPVSMKNALAGSLNIPAVKTLYLAGLDKTLDNAKKLGYTTLGNKDQLGLSLVLGGGEVTLLEHTNAYSAFAREGILSDPSFILKVEDKDGNVLEEYKDSERRVWDVNVAREINYCLSDNSARAFIFGANNFLTLGSRPVAAKTGTTNNNRDAWAMGYTPSIVTGVWVGNNDNAEIKAGADGSVVAAPIWNEYMRRVLGNDNIENFNAPTIPITGKAVLDGKNINNTLVKIDKASGLLATENTPASFIEERSYQEPHDILYYIDKDDPLGAAPKNPSSDPQFNLWEAGVAAWAKKNNIISSQAPTTYDNLHIPENKPVFNITNLSEGQTINNSQLNVSLEASAPRGVVRAEYYINGNLLQTNATYPFGLDAPIDFLTNGYYELTVSVCDDIDNCTDKKINFNFKASKTKVSGTTNISLNSPTNNQAINISLFPLALQATISNPKIIGRLQFRLVGSDGKSSIINSVNTNGQSVINSTWLAPPADGAYTIYAEAINWQDQTFTSSPATITISGNAGNH